MSLLKYVQDRTITSGNSRGAVSFSRAHIDGVPFRGSGAMLRNEEYEEFTEVVQDGHVEVFDLSNPDHKQKLEEIIDAAANCWYSIWKMQDHAVVQPSGELKIFVYCVWTQPYRELARHRVPQSIAQSTTK